MDLKAFENVQCCWNPKEFTSKNTKLFMKLIEEKYNVKLNNYWDLHKWSIQNLKEFWSEVWNFTEVKYSKRYEEVIDLSVPMSNIPKWFTGARLNLAENVLRYQDENVALTCIGEDREERTVTYSDLYKEVLQYSTAFRNFGLKNDDKVVCYMSNREEAVFAFFATISIGAIWVGTLPLLGAKATIARIKQVNPRILLTVDRFRNNKQEFDMLPNLEEIAQSIPSLEKIIIIPTKPCSNAKDISKITKSCFLEEFLNFGGNHTGEKIIFEQVPVSHPIFISFTSGTTGIPKALVHGNGCLFASLKDHLIHTDVSRDNVFLCVSPAGWASWNITPFQCLSGRRIVLYEGEPYFLTPTYLWDLIEDYKINSLFVTPGILDDLEKKGYVPTSKHTLAHFHILFAGASVVKPQNFDFVYQKVKRNIIFASAYGSTEVLGGLISLHSSLPIYRGEITCPCLGVEIQCLSNSGETVIGELGELVISKPIPSLPLGLYGDTDGLKYKKLYFSKYPDKFLTGDLATINPITKGIIIYGRSDEVLKPHGCRYGSSEIYNVVNLLPEIHDSVVVSQYAQSREERAVLFLKLKKGYKLDRELIKKVCLTIEKELTDEHVPGLILEVLDIPYNINGKKMEILIKKIINNMPYNSDVVKNKDSLQYFQNVPPFET